MKGLTDRRAVLLAAGTAAAAAVAGTVSAQPGAIHGTVVYEGGVEIPKGELVIRLEGAAPSGAARAAAAEARVPSEGRAKQVELSIPGTATARAAAAAPQEIVARLEREDGWLLARGSAAFTDGAPVEIVLYTAMY